MANYIQVAFKKITQQQSEILIALLSAAGYPGFEENENSLYAYIEEQVFDKKETDAIAHQTNLSYKTTFIKEQNWNKLWEANFKPVVIDDFVAIRAFFHEAIPGVEHEIVITPKMSFGTGHHATTYMMMQQMRKLNFKNKTVFDFGTGTGILAILAEKLGATHVVAIDNDDRSIENAQENIDKNECKNITFFKANTLEVNEKFEVVLANINKNVIIENISVLSEGLNKGGCILLSGLLAKDETDILEKAGSFLLRHNLTTHKEQWICITLSS